MDDAWQSQDMGPSSNGGGISIPQEVNMANGTRDGDDQWQGAPRSPARAPSGDQPRRSSRSRSPGARDRGDGGNNPGNNLHVSGLSNRVDTRDLEAAFAKVGRVKKAQVMYDPHTRESRGFGFVTMETGEEADAAITALGNTDFMGKTMTVEKARRGRARTPTPGRYYGPPKRSDRQQEERFYDPRPYDARYSRGYGGGGYDDPRGGRRPRYDDDYRGGGGGGGGRDYDRYRDDRGYDRGAPYERGGGGGYERRYDDRRY